MTAQTGLGFLAILPDLLQNHPFYEGFILGLQEDNTDTTSNCYTSEHALYELLTQTDLEFTGYKYATELKGNTATDIGYILNLNAIMNEASLIFFNLYASCFIELFFITLGRISNSPSIAGNLIVSFTSELIEFFWFNKGVTFDLQTQLQTTPIDYTATGKATSTWISSFLEFKVPTYKYNKFGKVVTSIGGSESGVTGS